MSGFPVAALVITAPPQECPIRTMGPVMADRKAATVAESPARLRSGLGGTRTG
jgi:hypothetical protein